MKYSAFILLIGISLIACNNDDDITTNLDNDLTQILEDAAPNKSLSYYVLPSSTDLNAVPADPNNSLTSVKVTLGQMLYHETALSINGMNPEVAGTFSCATCHHARAGFQAGIVQGIGDGGYGFGIAGEGRIPNPAYDVELIDVQPIRTPTAMNGAYQEAMLWNGQFGASGINVGTEAQWTPGTPKEVNTLGYEGLESQAIAGLAVHRMGLDTILQLKAYKDMIDEAFPEFTEDNRYTFECAGLAIAAFERTLLSTEAPFQKWLNGDNGAMTDAEKKGAILFFDKAQCSACHTGPALNSMTFYGLGMADLDADGNYGDVPDEDTQKGRGGFTKQAEDMYKFKTPQLYGLADAPFYGHGGNFTTLKELVEYKNNAVAQNSIVPVTQLAEEFVPLGLTDEEIENIVIFLEKSLLDPNLMRFEPNVVPSENCVPNNDTQSRIDTGCD
jgi:cytochrome c peroxidase